MFYHVTIMIMTILMMMTRSDLTLHRLLRDVILVVTVGHCLLILITRHLLLERPDHLPELLQLGVLVTDRLSQLPDLVIHLCHDLILLLSKTPNITRLCPDLSKNISKK